MTSDYETAMDGAPYMKAHEDAMEGVLDDAAYNRGLIDPEAVDLIDLGDAVLRALAEPGLLATPERDAEQQRVGAKKAMEEFAAHVRKTAATEEKRGCAEDADRRAAQYAGEVDR